MLTLNNIQKSYWQGGKELKVLKDISLQINEGELVAIMGPSGSGKSTLMNIIGCLDTATSGDYIVEGTDVKTLADNSLADFRNAKIGFVFQNFNLMPKLTVSQNVEMPLTYKKVN
ncbi:ABC transporter ATP-binding protein, partial [Enterococcus sp. 1001283B150225_161107_E12]